MRHLISLIFFSLFLSASLLDFSYLKEAKEAYNDKNYTKAQENYAKVNSDEAKFNEADSLYRQKKYKEAIEAYQTIVEPKLEAKKLHNIGNAYAQMKKIDKAIKSYEDALKLGEDKDTKFNLELLKKKKEEQKKKEDKKNDKKNKDKENQKDKDDKNKKDSKEKKDSDKKKSEDEKDKEQKDKDKEKKEAEKKKKEQEEKRDKEKNREKKKQEQQMNEQQMNEQNKTEVPISNMEERKWQKMLNQRGVNTLMIPLNKGKKENETNPW
jgi:Ca-activated chloride channel family protein